MLLQTYKMNNANADNISSGLCFRILFQNKDISYIFCIHPHTLCNLADRSYGLKLNCGQLQTRSNCFSCQKTPWKLISFLSLLLYPAARCLMKLTALQYIKCTNLLLHTVCCHHCWSLEFPCSGYMDKVQSTSFFFQRAKICTYMTWQRQSKLRFKGEIENKYNSRVLFCTALYLCCCVAGLCLPFSNIYSQEYDQKIRSSFEQINLSNKRLPSDRSNLFLGGKGWGLLRYPTRQPRSPEGSFGG